MKNKNILTGLFAIIIVGVGCFAAGYFSGYKKCEAKTLKQAIDSGYARYFIVDPYTGATELEWLQLNTNNLISSRPE